MSDLITRTARLVPYSKRPRHVPSFVTAYAYEPLADDPGSQLGNLYVVIEALVSGRASEEVADLIIETIGDHYYNQHKETSAPLERFESAIKATNAELGEHVNRGNAAWIGKLSAVIAVQVESELHVAQTGSAEAILYRGKSSTQITSGGHTRPEPPSKTFGSIASGQLEPGDRLLLATPALIHQVPLTRLQSIISQNGPNASIAEITALLKGASVDRISALVIEITTPELAALQVRSEQPSEIHLSAPETPLEAVKLVAEPLAQNTYASSVKVASAARDSWRRAKPHARSAGLVAADFLRRALNTKGGRRWAVIGLAVLIASLTVMAAKHAADQAENRVFAQYQSAYNQYVQGSQLASSGEGTQARTHYLSAQHQLSLLKPNATQINARLKHATIPENEPRSFSALGSLISAGLDRLDGLVRVTPSTVAELGKDVKASHFEIAGGKAYIIDSSDHNQIIITTLSNGATRFSKANLATAGDVIATTISSSNDGIYLLTSTPSVWFYRFDSDSATVQKVSYGSWSKAIAIGSYASNLYLLNPDGSVFKYTHNATGFSPKVVYLSTTKSNGKPTALAVDGSVYVASEAEIRQYVSAQSKQASPIPPELGTITNLRSSTDDNFLIGTSSSSKRVALWANAAALTFSRQIELEGVSEVRDATFDSSTQTFYALVDNKLVRFTNPS